MPFRNNAVPGIRGIVVERELTVPVSLTLPNGELNPQAVGWARRPLVDTSGIGTTGSWGRNKRWEYWNITTPTHVLAATVSLIDYAAVHEIWVLDRVTHQTWGRAPTVIPPRGATLPPSLNQGPVRAEAKDLLITIDHTEGITALHAEIPEASFDVHIVRPEGHDCLAVVVPWSKRRFQYTIKDVALPASGVVRIAGREHPIPAGRSWAVLDHGRGRWPYNVAWNWGAGSGLVDGVPFGIQVGGRWTDGTGSTENGILIGTVMTKICEELVWDYDLADWRRPWHISGGGLDATFVPDYNRHAQTNLGVIAARTDQCFGTWSGRFAETTFTDIDGWAEDVANRW